VWLTSGFQKLNLKKAIMTDSYRPLRTHLKHPKLRNLLAVLLALLVFGKGLAAQANIVINPIFDSSITSDPNAAAIESTIRSAIQAYQAVIANPITVTITFKEMTSGLGASSSYVGTISYSSYRSALAAAPATSTKATALAHLPSGANNPVNNNANITLTTANLRALGFNATPSSGQSDGTIWLNISLLNISRTSSSSSKYDLMSAAWHEMDEVLGFGSALNGLANGASAPTGSVWPLDLFRYDQNGNRSLNTASASLSYFSLDGSMRLVGFNQDARGDFSGLVQYWVPHAKSSGRFCHSRQCAEPWDRIHRAGCYRLQLPTHVHESPAR
jgi:hypothetical protein